MSGLLCLGPYTPILQILRTGNCSCEIHWVQRIPIAAGLDIPSETGQPSAPKRGLYRYLKPRSQEMRFSWIDTDDRRVYVEYSIE